MKFLLCAAALATVAGVAPLAAQTHEMPGFMQDWDANHDNKVPRAEFDAARAVRFGKVDANSDGGATAEEYLSEYLNRKKDEFNVPGQSNDDKLASYQRAIRQTYARFNALDKDRDGKMTKAEFDVSGGRVFARMDDDKDGTVTLADVKAVIAKSAANAKADAAAQP
ncbi:EF-hand domain-containing protein [Sphingobium chlorophenolicum]|uniref:EF-Hand domain-containing protein n=1 Tax=Sphingobium chlorophenolicum TaxID=46429 RepID=A0A081RA92_SPHCR|nr:hypothetical protein [Sphingobium chlorophenolicum]KEQ52115.1 EF-Hand domain-containing protein precursor [Sphingobium chlorophenolicum]